MAPDLNARHGPGPIANRTTRRDPLAVAFDTAAGKLIKRAIDARGMWVPVLVHTPGERFVDAGGLTHHERAFLQACYYHRLIYLWGGGFDGDGNRLRNPDRRYALERRWGEMAARGRLGGRVLRVRVHRVGEASLWAAEHGWTG